MSAPVSGRASGTVSSVVLVDDHELIRQGLARAFERHPDFTVSGGAASVAEGLEKVAALAPDVVVTDVRLPDGTGLDLVRTLREAQPQLGLVVLTMYAGDEQLFAALEAGASAFVAKAAPADEVVAAARSAVISPRSFFSADFAGALRRRKTAARPALTPRELEVLDLLAQGLGISALARMLFVSESTAKSHVAKIYEKLGAANRAQAIMQAVHAGLLGSDAPSTTGAMR